MSHGYAANDWKVGAAVFLTGLVAIGAYAVFTYESDEKRDARFAREEKKAAEQYAQDAPLRALSACQRAIRQVSRDPETVKVPYVQRMRDGADYRFFWSKESQPVRMRNGLGLEVPVPALCVVDEKSGRIKLLSIDGTSYTQSD